MIVVGDTSLSSETDIVAATIKTEIKTRRTGTGNFLWQFKSDGFRLFLPKGSAKKLFYRHACPETHDVATNLDVITIKAQKYRATQ